MTYEPSIAYFFLQSFIALALGLSNTADATPGPGTSAQGQTSYTPVYFGVGTEPIIDGLQTYSRNKVTLNVSSPVLTLDYGAEVAGFPYFEVTSVGESAAQIELKYSEPFAGLNLTTGDGPWYTQPGHIESMQHRLTCPYLGSTPMGL